MYTHSHTHNADGYIGFSLEVSGNRDLHQSDELSINEGAEAVRDSDFCIMLRLQIQFSKDMFSFYSVPRGTE